jgi:hypothetical protein
VVHDAITSQNQKIHLMKTLKIVGFMLAAGVGIPLAIMAQRGPASRNVPEAVAQSKDVAFLEKVAGFAETAAEFSPQDRSISRSGAYCRLGELGTAEALAAIGRLEAKAAKVNLTPATVPLGLSVMAGVGKMEVKPLVTATGPDGVTYGILSDRFFGGWDFFLISTKTPAEPRSWSRPILLPAPGQPGYNVRNPKLTFPGTAAGSQGVSLRFDYDFVNGNLPRNAQAAAPTNCTFSLPDVMRDTDQDGWTDLEEARLGLDPRRADTDADGMPDGQDSCPDFAPADTAINAQDTQILLRAIFALLGYSESRELLVVSPESPRIQVFGYTGPILSKMALPTSQADTSPIVARITWSIDQPSQSPEQATVTIRISRSAMASIMHSVSLRKIEGQWFATGHRLAGGS